MLHKTLFILAICIYLNQTYRLITNFLSSPLHLEMGSPMERRCVMWADDDCFVGKYEEVTARLCPTLETHL